MKRLIQERNNVTRVRIEPGLREQSRRKKNDVFGLATNQDQHFCRKSQK